MLSRTRLVLHRLGCSLAALLLVPSAAVAATRTVPCSGDITAALNGAIAASVNGDVVTIGAGSCAMGRLAMISNKNITIQGAGKTATILTADSGFGQIETTGANSPTWRLSGFTLTSTGTPGAIITVWANQAASWRGPFRIDHLALTYPNNGPDGAIAIYGPVYGVIDHSDFTQQFEAAILTGGSLGTENGASASTLGGAYLTSLAFRPGAADYLYIEDCTFKGTGSNGVAAIDTGYTGGRIVFRSNTLTNATLYAHWTKSNVINSLWWEVYNNTFTWSIGNGMYPMRLQGGGTGLVYDNTLSGFPGNFILLGEGRLPDQGQSSPLLDYCDGSKAWDGNAGDASAPGWPCLAQTGRDVGKTLAQIQAGDKQPSFPLYLWHNGPQATCRDAGGACDNSLTVGTYSPMAAKYFRATAHVTSGFGNGDVDYSITPTQPTGAGTHRLTYTPYAYPHPLTTGDVVPPPPPPPPPPPSTKFVLGDRVQVPAVGALARLAPALDASVTGPHYAGELGTVRDGPQTSGGFAWWFVDYDTGGDGWTTETNLDHYTAPLPPVDCVVSDWGLWHETSAWSACVDGSQTRAEERFRTVLTAAGTGGTACPVLVETRMVAQPCVLPPPPDVCAGTTWTITGVKWPTSNTGSKSITFSTGTAAWDWERFTWPITLDVSVKGCVKTKIKGQ